MNKREKIKKWFKDHFTKDKIMPWVLTGLIMLLVLLCVYFENKDKKNMENKQSEISLCDTEENLKTSWTINQDGNLVGDNLLNGVPLNVQGGTTYNLGTASLYANRVYTVSFILYSGDASACTFNAVGYGALAPQIFSNGNYTFSVTQDLNNVQITGYINGTADCAFMLNEGSTPLPWEPYGVWYSSSNYDNYGNIRYNNGRASVENQFYYFNDKTIYYYADESPYQDQLVGYQYLEQDSFTNFTINATNIVEEFWEQHSVDYYYGKITLNILSSEFYANFIYPVSTIDGYIKIMYADGTSYNVESYSLNREFHIYDGSQINPEKYITDIYIQFEYDALLSVDITTSVNAVYYNNGYNEGYDKGYTNGNVDGLQVGRNNGYNEGYEVGYNNGINQDITTSGFKTLFNSILSYPINLISSVFNFEFMGINIASTIFFLISCGIVLWIIKRLWK